MDEIHNDIICKINLIILINIYIKKILICGARIDYYYFICLVCGQNSTLVVSIQIKFKYIIIIIM